MRYTFRPLGAWTEGDTSPRRGSHVFKASWDSTLDLLGRELDHLDAQNVVVQVDVREGDVRLDGMLRADATVGHPGVRIAFDSRFGSLTYATDAHERHYDNYVKLDGWQANVRAIALGLEALRAVDRYGVTRRGEQYSGWRALPSGTGPAPTHMTGDEALAVIDELTPESKRGEPLERRVRWAKVGAHPDRHGGDRSAWDGIEQAAAVLGVRS